MSRKTLAKIYLAIIAAAFVALAVTLNFLPRSTYSEVEKRDLMRFPRFSWDALYHGDLTDSISLWYSDSEPFRDRFMSASVSFKDLIAITQPGSGGQTIKFHAAEPEPESAPGSNDEREIGEYKNKVTANAHAKIAHAGILVVGSEGNARALMAYGGGEKSASSYADIANKYKQTFPDVNIYCMIIPTAIEFYCPDGAKGSSKSQRAAIQYAYSRLRDDVKAVDIYTELGRHADEDIYLRTDHHWSPLGGFYAARKFAQVAGVPFKELTSYERHVVHGFVGTMYGYSKDITVKNSPEDFVYYIPKGIDYSTNYIDYTIDKDFKVTGEKPPRNGIFFVKHPDGSSGAYCTFMGGDAKIVKVTTGTKNGRRLIILKDSFGNTLPGYLFYSFEQIHVIDNRYFTKNMKRYVRDNKITDIVFANNTYSACVVASDYQRFLTQ